MTTKEEALREIFGFMWPERVAKVEWSAYYQCPDYFSDIVAAREFAGKVRSDDKQDYMDAIKSLLDYRIADLPLISPSDLTFAAARAAGLKKVMAYEKELKG